MQQFTKILNSSIKSKLSYLFVFFLIIYSSGASIVAVNEVALVLSTIIGICLIYKFGSFELFVPLLKALVLIVLFMLYYYLVNEAINITTWMGVIVKLTFAFIVVQICFKKFAAILIDIVFILCQISLVFYIIQLIVPQTLFEINNLFGLEARENSNSLLFNFTYIHEFRNCGPMWEPGAFAVLICIALLFNNIVLKIKDRKVNKVLLLALITTFSTTGYLIGVLIILATFKEKIPARLRLLSIPAIFIVFGLIFQLNFIGVKIESQYSNLNSEIDKVYQAAEAEDESIVSITRFATLYIDVPTFLKRPILGYGVDIMTVNKKEYYKKYGENINRSSGLMLLLLQVGIVGTIVYLLILFQKYKKYYGLEVSSLVLVVILIILFANPLESSPLLLSLFFYKKSILENKKLLSYILSLNLMPSKVGSTSK